MTLHEEPSLGRLDHPLPISTFPFVETIDLEEAGFDPDERSPCLPTAVSRWFVFRPSKAGRLVIDLAGSTPLDPVVRLYRRVDSRPGTLVFLGCASPVWNGNLVLEAEVLAGETYAAQVGTSASREGRVVLRAELRDRPLVA